MLIKYVFALFVAMTTMGYAQHFDDFSDGDFSVNPQWKGDTSKFIVNADSMLQLQAPAISGVSTLYLENEAIVDANFYFKVKTEFNPSSQNYLIVYLQLEGINFGDDAIFLEVGRSQDKIRLIKRVNGVEQVALQSTVDITDNSKNDMEFDINRSVDGIWELKFSVNGNSWVNLGQYYDPNILSNNRFAFECHYTATRSTKFYFDDILITGSPFVDELSPWIIDIVRLDSFQVKLKFNEPLDSTTITPESFSFSNASTALNIDYSSSDSSLSFSVGNLDWNRETILTILDWTDESENKIKDASIVLNWQKIYPGDILFSEIMFDPTPPVYLPEYEFLEIYINTTYSLTSRGIQLMTDGKIIELPIHELKPGGIYIIGENYPNIEQVDSTNNINCIYLPSMSNSEGNISIWNKNGELINAISYQRKLLDEQKQNGGWSLELSQLNEYCSMESWQYSSDYFGGSPGYLNEGVLEEIDRNIEFRVQIINDQEIWLESNLILDDPEWIDPSNFVFNGEFRLSSVERKSGNLLKLVSHYPFEKGKEIQLGITFNSISCFGEEVKGTILTFQMPENALSENVHVSEILFNPSDKIRKFVEFVQQGTAPIDCFDLLLGQKSIDSDEWDFYPVSSAHTLWYPTEFLVLTGENGWNSEVGNCNEEILFMHMNSFPSLPKSGAKLGLFRRNHLAIDTFCYQENWHADYLVELEGVSLERLDYNNDPCLKNSWNSASELTGYSSPGCENSFQNKKSVNDRLEISSDIISSRIDVEHIDLTFKLLNPDENISVLVYNLDGLLVEILARNKFAIGEGVISWSGKNHAAGSFVVQAIIMNGEKLVQQEKWLINLLP